MEIRNPGQSGLRVPAIGPGYVREGAPSMSLFRRTKDAAAEFHRHDGVARPEIRC